MNKKFLLFLIGLSFAYLELKAQEPTVTKNFEIVVSERVEGIQINDDKKGIYTNVYGRSHAQPILYEISQDPLDLLPYATSQKVKFGENSSVPVSIDKIAKGLDGEMFYTIAKVTPSGSSFQYSYYLMKSTSSNPSFKQIAEIGAKEKTKKYFQNIALLSNGGGGVYWIGTTRLKPSPSAEVNNDIVIISFDRQGKVKWQKKYNAGRYDEANSAIITSDGGIVIGGKLNSKRGLVKFTGDGTVVWTYQPKNYGSIGKILESDDSSIILCGEGGPNSSRKNGNVHLEKIGKDGKLIWAKEYDNPSQTGDDTIDLLISKTTSIYLLVYSKLKKGRGLNLVQFDKDGNYIKEKRMLDLQKIPKTYAGIENLSFLRQIGDNIGVFSESNLKGFTGLFASLVDEKLETVYEHIIPRNGSTPLNPLEAFYFEDGSLLIVAKGDGRFRAKNKISCYSIKF